MDWRQLGRASARRALVRDWTSCFSEPFRKPWRRGVLAALLLAASLPATELDGTIRDPQGFVIVEARVLLRQGARETAPTRFASSDSQGRFRFTDLPPGPYRLEAYAAGFERRTAEVEIDGPRVTADLELQPAGLHEGVVVTASRQEADTESSPLPTSVFSGQRLREQMPTNLAQALFEAPGVSWVNAGAFRGRPVIRGLDSNRILVLVDGERLNNNRTSTGQGGIETALVDVSDIEQAEVVRGPGSVLYGSDAFGGVINIRTHSGRRRDGLGVGARLGATALPNSDGRRAHAELSAGNRWFSVRGRGSVGALQNYRTQDATVYFSGADESGALGELKIFPSSDQSFSFKFLHHGGYNFGLPSLDPNPVFLAEFPFSKLNKYSGGYQKSFDSSALSSIRANVYSQSQTRSFFNRIAAGPGMEILSDTITDVGSAGFDVQATSLPSSRHVLTYGVTHYRDRNRDFRLQTMVGAGPSPIVLDAAPSVPNSSFSGSGIFLQDQFQATRRLRITGGLRGDRFVLETSDTPGFDPGVSAVLPARQTDSAVSGNLGASVDAGGGWLFSANLGRAFRAPNLFERFFFGRGSVGGFIVPNANLEPETSLQLDTGVHFRSGPAKVSVNYFRNRLDNLISSAAGTFQGQPTLAGQPIYQNINIEEARIQGVESSAEFSAQALDSQWRPTFSVAWQRGDNLVTGQALPLIAPLVAQARLRWSPQRSRLWSELGMVAVPGSQRVPEGFTPIKAYTVFTWRAGYELIRGESGLGAHLPAGVSSVNLYAGLENLGGRTYYGLFETVPQPGRDFRFGVELSLDSSAR
ncbi:MAG: TonB-dependent receptor [Acidobacteria bacterium]|nr:TonB-dependent receptor [Acidobacteriota bacterium]